MGEIKSQTISGVKWSAIERLSIQIVTFFISLVVARILTPSDYGLIGMTGVFFTISNALIDGGFGNALVRKPDLTEADYYTAFYFSMGMSVVCAAVLFLTSPLIAGFFNQPLLSPIVKALSLNLIIGQLGMIPGTRLYIALNFKTLAKINFIGAVSSGLVGLAVAYFGGGVWAIVSQAIFASVITVILKWVYSPSKLLFIFSKNSFKELFGFGSKLTASVLINTVYSEMTPIVIGKFYTPAALGFYSRGTSIATLPVRIITEIVGKVTFPILSKIQNDNERLIKIYRSYISLIMMGVVFTCLLMAALAKPLILLLLTAKWSQAIIFLQIFAFSIVFDPICSLNLNLLQVKGRSDLFLRLEVIKKIIALVILIAAIPFGVVAICFSKVVYTQVAVYLNTYYTGKLFGLGYWQQCKDFLPYFGYTIVACTPAFLLSIYCPWHMVSLIAGALSAVIIYILLLCVFRDPAYMEHVSPIIGKWLVKLPKFCRFSRLHD